MAGSLIAGAFLFAGYTLLWWGWMRLGGPVDFLNLLVPGAPEPVRGG